MRVLCSTTPMEGVFGPFIPLGRALATGGHEVIVATGPDLPQRGGDHGLRFETAGLPAMDGVRAAFDDPTVKAAPHGDRVAFPAAMFGSVIPSAKLPALRRLAKSWRPQLVIHPPVDLAGPLLAEELGIPSACYGFGQPFDEQTMEAIGERARPLWEQAGLTFRRFGGAYRGDYLDPRPSSLALSAIDVEGAVIPIRPEVPGEADATLPDWAASLGTQPSVYLSLGTAPLFNAPDKFKPLIAGLAGAGVNVVATVSKLHDPAALGELPDTVHVEQWLSLAALLPHCAAVVCHAGTGTVLAALASGLPMVLIPQGADQFENAEACLKAGAARVLIGDAVTPTAVAEAARAVLAEGAPEAAAARAIAAEIAAMPTATAVAARLTTPAAVAT